MTRCQILGTMGGSSFYKSNIWEFAKNKKISVVGQLHNFIFIIRGKLWEVVKNSKKGHIFTKKSIIKNLGQLANKKAFYKKITLFSMLASFELQICPDHPCD